MKTAMILAAGRGERLKPLTEMFPKALCRLKNIPLIEYHLERLAQAGFEHIIVNHAYLGGKIRQHLIQNKKYGLHIHFSPEPPGGLETGGGILNALPWFKNEPFVAVNADIYTDYDFSLLQLPAHSLAHVVLVAPPRGAHTGDFGLNSLSLVQNHPKTYTFSGIACYHPKLFNAHKPGRFSVTPILRDLAEKQQITGEYHHGVWFDIGTMKRLQFAESQLKEI